MNNLPLNTSMQKKGSEITLLSGSEDSDVSKLSLTELFLTVVQSGKTAVAKDVAISLNLPEDMGANVQRALLKYQLLDHKSRVNLIIMKIQKGDFNEVEKLLQWIDINCLLEGKTLLHWAALAGKIEAVKQLSELGASWNVKDDEQISPLEIAEEKAHYDAIRAVFLTTLPPGMFPDVGSFFKQHGLISLENIGKFFSLFENEVVAKRYLSWMKDHPLVVQYLFQKYLALDPKSTLLARGIAICQKENIPIGNINEDPSRLAHYHTTRSLAHIVGDSFIRNLSDKNGPLEGHTMTETIPYVQVMLQKVIHTYQGALGSSTLQCIQKVHDELIKGLENALLIKELTVENMVQKDPVNAKKRLEELVKVLRQELQALKEGENFALPWGWTTPKGGHAMFINLQKGASGTWKLEVLNTGAGISLGPSIQEANKKKWPFATVYEKVPDSVLLNINFLELTLEPQCLGQMVKESDSFSHLDLYLSILDKNLGEYKKKLDDPSEGTDLFITGQRSGTCAMRVIMIYLRLRLGKDVYKQVKHLLFLETVKGAFEVLKSEFKANPIRRRVMQDGLKNIARQALKLPQERRALTAEQIQKLWTMMEEAAPKMGDQALQIEADPSHLGKRQVKWMDALEAPLQNICSNPIPPAHPRWIELGDTIITAAPKTAKELLEKLRQSKRYIEKCPWDLKESLATRLVLEIPFPESPFLESMQSLSTHDAKQLLQEISTLSNLIGHSTPNQLLALQATYGLAFVLSCNIDEKEEVDPNLKIATYGADPKPLELLLKNHYIAFADPKMEAKAFTLLQFLKMHAKSAPLFSCTEWKDVEVGSSFYSSKGFLFPPPLNSPEEKFLKSLQAGVQNWGDFLLDCPPGVHAGDWRMAKLFEKMTPEKLYLLRFREIYYKMRLNTISKGTSHTEFKVNHISGRNPWEKDQILWGSGSDFVNAMREALNLQDKCSMDCKEYELLKKEQNPLSPHPENRTYLSLNPSLRSLFTIRAEPQLALIRLLQHFEENITDFEKLEMQGFFMLTLFHTGDWKLLDELAKNPTFATRLIQLIEKRAIPLYQKRLLETAQTSERDPNPYALLFLLTVMGTFATYVNDAEMFSRSFEKLKQLIDPTHPECPDPFKHRQISKAACQALLQILLRQPEWSKDHILQACFAAAKGVFVAETDIGYCKDNLSDNKRRSSEWKQTLLHHSDTIARQFSDAEFKEAVLNAIVHATSVSGKWKKWKGVFPCYKSTLMNEKGQEIGPLEVNVLHGQVFLNGIPLNQIGFYSRTLVMDIYSYYGDRAFGEFLFELFSQSPSRIQEIKYQNDVYVCYHKIGAEGKIELTIMISKAQRKGHIQTWCRGRPFQLLHPKQSNQIEVIQKNFPIPFNFNNLFCGISADDGEREILIVDKSLKPLGILTHDGKWIENPQDPNATARAIGACDLVNGVMSDQWEPEESQDAVTVILKKYDPASQNTLKIEFLKVKDHLILKEDHRYRLSSNQRLAGMGDRRDTLILEDCNGNRKVFFLGIGKGIYDLDRDDRPKSAFCEINGWFAAQAICQGEHLTAKHYLNQMTLHSHLGTKSLLALKKIIENQSDCHPNTYALKIKACSMAFEAIKNRPLLSSDKKEKKELYKWISDFKGSFDFSELLDKYFELELNISEPLLLHHLVELKVAKRWMRNDQKIQGIFSPKAPLAERQGLRIYRFDLLSPSSKDQITSFDALFPRLRPGENFKKCFNFLYQMASNPEEKKKVEFVIDSMGQDRDQENLFLQAILDAAVRPEKSPALAKEMKEIVDALRLEKWIPYNDTRCNQLLNLVQQWINEMGAGGNFSKGPSTPKLLGEKPQMRNRGELLNLARQQVVDFKISFERDPCSEMASAVQKVSQGERELETIQFPEAKTELEKSRFAALNDDYQMGQKKNFRDKFQVDKLKLANAIETIKFESIEPLKQSILKLGRKGAASDVDQRDFELKMVGELLTPITIDDCILAFLKNDSQMLQAKNPNLTLADGDQICSMTGEFLAKSLELWRQKTCVERAKKLLENKDPNLEESLVELFVDGINTQIAYDPRKCLPFLVFEYYASHFLGRFVRLRKDQVEDLQLLLQKDRDGNYKNIALQKIMGAGKTFVFGTILAYLKADGEHLSLHIPPSSLFKTNCSEMLERVHLFFQQKGVSLEFTRAAEHFSEQYLMHLLDTLNDAIVNKKVVIMSPETAHSFRNRYIEMRDKIAGGSTEDIETSILLLEKILILLREKGVVCSDEIDLTLAPNKEHNYPVGARKPLSADALDLIRQIHYFAFLEPTLSLQKNLQSHLTLDQRKQITSRIAKQMIEYLVLDSKWKDRFLVYLLPQHEQKEVIEKLHHYLMTHDAPPPPILLELRGSKIPQQRDLAELLVLLRKELRDWLPEGWKRNLNEHYGRSHKLEDYELAKPYKANNTPNESAEFADLFEMINRTYHLYMVEGLTQKQVCEWVERLRNEAMNEWRQEMGECSLAEVPMAAHFEKITGIKLFSFNLSDKKGIEKIQKALLNSSKLSMQTLLDFTMQSVLSKVEIPLRQVSSNPQTLCSMFKTFQGYSGTVECADTFPDKIAVQKDVGTNGQTIDLLHRKCNRFHHLKVEDSLIDSVLRNHPQLNHIHAIIDIGAHYCGRTNVSVAKELALFFKDKATIKGILYFDEKNNWPYFIKCQNPDELIELPSTDAEAIAQTTGVTLDEMFTYYDQRNITGQDIRQAFDAVAIATIGKNTTLREILQGVRRLRGLDYAQKVEFALFDEIHSVHELIAFAEANQVEFLLKYNLLSVLQKIENGAEEAVLKEIFQEPGRARKNQIFASCKELFTKVLQDELYPLFADKINPIDAMKFLDGVKNGIIDQLNGKLKPAAVNGLAIDIDQIVSSALKKNMIPPLVDGNMAQNSNRESTMEQEQTRVQEQEKKQEQTQEIEREIDDRRSPYKEMNWTERTLLNPEFPTSRSYGHPKIDPVQNHIPARFAPCFRPHILMTENFQRTAYDTQFIISGESKHCHFVLAYPKVDQWFAILLSQHDAANVRIDLDRFGDKTPVPYYLLDVDGKIVTDRQRSWDPAWLNDPKSQLTQNLVQILVLQGRIQTLCQPNWLKAFQVWMESGNGDLKRDFIENFSLKSVEQKERYQGTRLSQVVHNMGVEEAERLGIQTILDKISDPNFKDFVRMQHYIQLLSERKPMTDRIRRSIVTLGLRIIQAAYEELTTGDYPERLARDLPDGFYDTFWNKKMIQQFFDSLDCLDKDGKLLMRQELIKLCRHENVKWFERLAENLVPYMVLRITRWGSLL